MKKCTKRKTEKEIGQFFKAKVNKDGLSYWCKSCDKERCVTWRQQHVEDIIEYSAQYYSSNRQEIIKYSIQYKKDHLEKITEYNNLYYEAHKDDKKQRNVRYYADHAEERIKEALAWAKANLGKKNANTTKRHVAKLQRIPSWITEEMEESINNKYIESARLTKETGITHHVDHIVPLQGKNVSGLHVPWNLQILTEKENISKGNKLINTGMYTEIS